MSIVAGMRSTLMGFVRHDNWFTPFYECIDGGAVAYNGSHYTLFLESSMPPPCYPGHTWTLVCESHTIRVWHLDYCCIAHLARVQRKAPVTTARL